jgi:hypothetical protein
VQNCPSEQLEGSETAKRRGKKRGGGTAFGDGTQNSEGIDENKKMGGVSAVVGEQEARGRNQRIGLERIDVEPLVTPTRVVNDFPSQMQQEAAKER